MDVFVHIPKTAGTTLRAIISREYGADRVLYYREPPEAVKPGLLRMLISLSGPRLVTGHYAYGLHTLLKTRCRYFSMVRDPIRRAISNYYFAFNSASHGFRDEILSGRLGLDEFLADDRYSPPWAQADMLLTGRRPSPDSYAESALENIRTGFLFVGTSERFLESGLLLAKAMQWRRPPLFAMRNATRLAGKLRDRRDRAEADACARYQDRFAADYRVYDEIDRIISQKIAADGRHFARAIAAFREIQEHIAAHTQNSVFDNYELDGEDVLPGAALRYVGSEPYREIEEYLRSEDPFALPGRNYIGHVDAVEGAVVSGWATDLSRFEPIYVTLRRGGAAIATARCDLYREDLAQAGLGTGNLAFRCELDAPLREARDLAVCFEDTKIELWPSGPSE